MTTTPEPRSPGASSSEAPATPVEPTPSVTPPGPAREAGAKTGDPLRGSRTSGAYAAMIAFAVVLVLLIIFIAQNTDDASVSYLGWEGSAPLAVLLLIATAAGMLLAGVAATARILQLRRRVKRERRR